MVATYRTRMDVRVNLDGEWFAAAGTGGVEFDVDSVKHPGPVCDRRGASGNHLPRSRNAGDRLSERG